MTTIKFVAPTKLVMVATSNVKPHTVMSDCCTVGGRTTPEILFVQAWVWRHCGDTPSGGGLCGVTTLSGVSNKSNLRETLSRGLDGLSMVCKDPSESEAVVPGKWSLVSTSMALSKKPFTRMFLPPADGSPGKTAQAGRVLLGKHQLHDQPSIINHTSRGQGQLCHLPSNEKRKLARTCRVIQAQNRKGK